MNTPDGPENPEFQVTGSASGGENLRDDITDMIAYALWRHWKLRPRQRDLSATRRWAAYVTAHLRLCGVEWRQKPPPKGHSDVDH